MTRCTAYRPQLERLAADPDTAVGDDLARHLDACPPCRERFDAGRVDLEATAFGELSPRQRERLLDALARERAAGSFRIARRALAAAAIVAAVGASAWYLTSRQPRVPGSAAVSVALIEDHIRYLGHPDREPAMPRAELEAYLRPHVDFPVELPEPPGVRLRGARRCYLLGRRVALAFYDTPQGPVSYFALGGGGLEMPREPCAGAAALGCSAHDGYRMVAWREAGLLHAFVGSDERALTRLAEWSRERRDPKADSRRGSR